MKSEGTCSHASRIYPIYKVGDEETTRNCRGISLLNTGYKILTSITGGRLIRWIETNKIIRESQARFRMERGARDHIFVLNSLINGVLKRRARNYT